MHITILGAVFRFPLIAVLLLHSSLIMIVAPVCAASDLTMHVSAGISLQGWRSGLELTTVPIETESLQAFRLEGRMAWRGHTVLSVSHDRSLTGTPEQEDMLSASNAQGAFLQRTLGVVDLLSWISGSEKVCDGVLDFWDRLIGLRVSYTNDLHLGSTASDTTFAFVGFDEPDMAKVYENGDQLAFRTLFRDLRIETPIWVEPKRMRNVARIGYFRSRWDKVSDLSAREFEGLSLVEESRRDISGLTLGYDSGLDWPGLRMAVSIDVGMMGTGLTTPEPRDDDEVSPTYKAIHVEFRWNLSADGGRTGVTTTIGAAYELREWQYGADNDVDRDTLTRVFGRVGFDFIL